MSQVNLKIFVKEGHDILVMDSWSAAEAVGSKAGDGSYPINPLLTDEPESSSRSC